MTDTTPDSVSEFLDVNYHIFAIVGVFSALVIYLQRLGDDRFALQTAVSGALFVLLVVVMILFVRLFLFATRRFMRREGIRDLFTVLVILSLGEAVFFLVVGILSLISINELFLQTIAFVLSFSLALLALIVYFDYFYSATDVESKVVESVPVGRLYLRAGSLPLTVILFVGAFLYVNTGFLGSGPIVTTRMLDDVVFGATFVFVAVCHSVSTLLTLGVAFVGRRSVVLISDLWHHGEE